MHQHHVSGRVWSALAVTGALALGLVVAPAADPPTRRMNVRGTATVPLDGDLLELRLVVTGQSELAEEAHRSFSQNRQRVIEAFEGLGVEGLAVRGLGRALAYEPPEDPADAAVRQQVYFNGVEHLDGAQYWEVLLVTVPGQDALDADARGALLARLVDAAVDNGVELLGGQRLAENRPPAGRFDYAGDAPARYRSADPAGAERRAYLAAIADARDLAAALAAEQGERLGAPLSVDLQPTTVVYRRGAQNAYYGPQGNSGQPEPDADSRGSLSATVTVGFQLE
jgi:uncharacterized protein YggE